jgi:cytochrome d ubiquinol oxidase subunit I
MTAALIGSVTVILAGHQQAQRTIAQQPMKMAAAEALWNSEDPAALSLVSIINEPGKENLFAIRVPYALSFLAHDSLQGEVQGINQLQAEYEKRYGPGNYIPPVVVLFWGFRFMVGAGLVMALLAALGLFFIWKKRLDQQRWFLRLLVASIAIPYIANTSGWIMTEMGRQPWLVSGLLKTVDGISPSVSPTMILLTLIGFLLLYGVLAVVDGTLLFKFARQGISPVVESADKKDEPLVVTY